jgi:hypothetical protein
MPIRLLDRYGESGDAVHCGEQRARVLAGCPEGALAVPVVNVAEGVQTVVALPGVGDDRRASTP